MEPAQTLSILLAAAWLLPLASFVIIVLFGPRLGKHGVLASYVATGAILAALALSSCAFVYWLSLHGVGPTEHVHAGHGDVHAAGSHTEAGP